MNDITPQAREATEPWWLIYYEDASCTPEVFNDEKAARRTFEMRQVSWTCHLFSNESAVQSLLASRDARVAELERVLSKLVNCNPLTAPTVFSQTRFEARALLVSLPSPSAVTDDSRIQPKEDEK